MSDDLPPDTAHELRSTLSDDGHITLGLRECEVAAPKALVTSHG